MARFDSPLGNVRVAAPCSADWEQMIGNERARFCGQCNLNVYNLSSMTKSEAESFIARSEGRVCVRFYRRRDGSIITDNCPVGLRALRRRMSQVARAVASAVLSFLTGLGVYEVLSGASVLEDHWRTNVMGTSMGMPDMAPAPAAPSVEPTMPRLVVGEMAVVSPQPGSFQRKVRSRRH
jgi:hypothetical protein